MRMAIIVLFMILFNSCSIHKETKTTWLNLDIDRFYNYNDSVVFRKFTSINSQIDNLCKLQDTIKFNGVEVLAFSWNGYVGLEDYVRIIIHDDQNIVHISTMDSIDNLNVICQNQLDSFLYTFRTGKKIFIISDGHSFGFCQYIIVKNGDAIVFAQVSYGPTIYTANDPKSVINQILKQYSKVFN